MCKRIYSVVFIIVIVMIMQFVTMSTVQAATKQYYVVSTKTAYQREEASVASKALNTLVIGDKVESVSSSGEWQEIKAYGVNGYVKKSQLMKVTSKTQYLGIAKKQVSLKKSKSPKAKNLQTIKKETRIDIRLVAGAWCKVSYDKKTGYIESKYMKHYKIIDVSNKPKLPIVMTSTARYTPSMLKTDLDKLSVRYPDRMAYFDFGKSTWGTPLYCAIVGNPNAQTKILINGNAHAREYMTTQLMMKQIEQLCKDYKKASYNGVAYKDILNDVALYFVPMLNPDGTRISQDGISAVPQKYKKYVKKVPFTRDCPNYRMWKGNGIAVDLNRNYPIGWKKNNMMAGSWSGEYPFQATEAVALAELCKENQFVFAINYHAMGSIIYWRDKHISDKKTRPLANVINGVTGYRFVYDNNSEGGFKGWFVYTFKKPSFTIEIGTATTPLPISQFNGIWKRNQYVPIASAKYFYDN